MRVLRKLHLWLGLGLGVILVLQALTGLALVFYDRIILARLANTATLAPPSNEAGLAADLAMIETLAGHTGWRRVLLPSDSLPLYKVTLAGNQSALLAPGATQWADFWRGNRRPEAFLLDFHYRLLLGTPGENAAGAIGLAGLFMTVTGLILWWPKRGGWRWQALTLSDGRRRPQWLAFHWGWGVLTSALIGLSIITGAGMIFYAPLQSALGVKSAPSPQRPWPGNPATPIHWPAVVATAATAWPDDQLRMVSNAPAGSAALSLRTKTAGEMHPNGRSLIHVDRRDGALIGQYDARQQSLAAQGLFAFYPIHSGRGYPIFTLTALIAGVGLTLMTLSGFSAYFKKPKPRRKNSELNQAT